MTPLRGEDITLFCEDASRGRSQRLIEAALQELRASLPFVLSVMPVGISSKNDVQVRAKFAREDGYRAFGLRDRDFLPRAQVDEYRGLAFAKSAANVNPWPLSRHCIESYLLDDDVLGAVMKAIDVAVLRTTVDEAALARRWLDVARGTVEDLAWRLRRGKRESIKGRPSDKESAMTAAREVTKLLHDGFLAASADDRLTEKLTALTEDMQSDGPLRHRVDGRELVKDVEQALTASHGSSLPPGGLLSALDRRAHERPPEALLAELRAAMEAIPLAWRLEDA